MCDDKIGKNKMEKIRKKNWKNIWRKKRKIYLGGWGIILENLLEVIMENYLEYFFGIIFGNNFWELFIGNYLLGINMH